jgi:hypothetical protein
MAQTDKAAEYLFSGSGLLRELVEEGLLLYIAFPALGYSCI